MRITDLLKPEGIKLGGSPKNKAEAIDQMVELMVKEGNINDKQKYKAAVLAREAETSTAIGEGIAIPHAKTDAVDRPGLAAMTVPGGVDYDAPDDEPSNIIFLIAAPNTKENVHLEVLSRLSTLLMDDDFTDALRNAKSVEEFRSIVDKAEAEKLEAEENKSYGGGPQILAITACPTGIAHTYMAAEALEKKAKEMGYILKAETQGSAGAKNILTAEEIKNAQGIIIAADKKIDLARFGGKQVLQTSVSAGINKPEELINTIINNQAPVLDGSAPAAAAAPADEGFVRSFYKNLMNGVSHMLPFVVGGGILIALSFLVDGIMAPDAGSSLGSATGLARFFNQTGSAAFGFMLPILAGFIAMSIADRPGLAVGMAGGFLANAGSSWFSVFGSAAAVGGGFLGAMFAGFAGGYLTKWLEKQCEKLPDSLEGIKPVLLYPLFGMLGIGLIMFTVNPVFSGINGAMASLLQSMGTSNLVLLGAITGGMMSIDMGGPFNKASYAFGLAMLSQSMESGDPTGQIIMAAIMAGGMVPPIAIALSTTFFKDLWTEDQQKAGLVNYIMGISFISEGAIPFAAAEPQRVLPACIIGSAVSGALTAVFGCTSPAPHGGLWVFPIIGKWPLYIVAVLIGSIVGCVILTAMKKKAGK